MELFAFIIESMIFQVNQISAENKKTFIGLLSDEKENTNALIDEILFNVIKKLRIESRLIVDSDIEENLLNINGVERVYCLQGMEILEIEKHHHVNNKIVSLIVIPSRESYSIDSIVAEQSLINQVQEYIENHELLTVQTQILPIRPIELKLNITVYVDDFLMSEDEVKEGIIKEINRFLNFHKGGNDGLGWSPNKYVDNFKFEDQRTTVEIDGNYIFVSDIISLIDRLDGVNSVEANTSVQLGTLFLSVDDKSRIKEVDDLMWGIFFACYEMPFLAKNGHEIIVERVKDD